VSHSTKVMLLRRNIKEVEGSVNAVGLKDVRPFSVRCSLFRPLTGGARQGMGDFLRDVADINIFHAAIVAFGTLLLVAGGAVEI